MRGKWERGINISMKKKEKCKNKDTVKEDLEHENEK